jgi:hypothetical protein
MPILLTTSHPESLQGEQLAILDTISGSALHSLFGNTTRIGYIPKLYIISILLTFVPLLIGAALSPLSLTIATCKLKLPFFYDWNVLFMFLISFPFLLILTVTDQEVLTNALRSVQREGTITISEANTRVLYNRWKDCFKKFNIVGQVIGVGVGLLVAYFNYEAYTPELVGFWIAQNNSLLPVGFVYLYCISFFYALIVIYVVRNIGIALLLRDIVANSELHMLPMHPDRSGGLRPLGTLGLRNQYILTLLGLNVVLLITVYFPHFEDAPYLHGMVAAALIAYMILGPLIFVAPLLPFRDGMIRTKGDLMEEVAQRLRVELDRVRAELPSGHISREDEELIDRLRKIASLIDELPVWPFDTATLRKFLTAYTIPIISSAVPALKFIISLTKT